jgi:predicted ATP-dependent endonuclease of OLD family
MNGKFGAVWKRWLDGGFMVKLSNVRVEGFRLLECVDLAIEPGSTVIVGRNNSGKTSLTEVSTAE